LWRQNEGMDFLMAMVEEKPIIPCAAIRLGKALNFS